MLLWIWTSNYTFKRLSFLPGTSTGLVHDFDHICIVLSGKKKTTPPPYCFLFVILIPLILHIKSVLYFTHPIFKVVVIYQTRIFYTRSANFFFFCSHESGFCHGFLSLQQIVFLLFWLRGSSGGMSLVKHFLVNWKQKRKQWSILHHQASDPVTKTSCLVTHVWLLAGSEKSQTGHFIEWFLKFERVNYLYFCVASIFLVERG